MSEIFSQLPEGIQSQIVEITKTSGLPENEVSYEKMALAWEEKRRVFEEQTRKEGMKEVNSFAKESEQGAIALTYSGSLILIGPLQTEGRNVAYSSIGLRQDVPEKAVKVASILAKDVNLDAAMEFERGPVKRTSPIYKLAVCCEELTLLEQEAKIAEVTVIMTEQFIEINKSTLPTNIS